MIAENPTKGAKLYDTLSTEIMHKEREIFP